MILHRTARPTLTAVEMNHGDVLHFKLADGTLRTIELVRTSASVYSSNLGSGIEPGPHAKVVLRMNCILKVDGFHVNINRWVGSQESFYEPWSLMGLHLWFDAASALFDHLTENHGTCKPRAHARLAIQDASLPIVPVLLHPWCPLPAGGLRIEQCYQGSDCWMGPYYGVDAHGGLDINHPAGTPIWTPFAIDRHEMFATLEGGENNNRWRGFKQWPDGSTWVIQVHHIIRLLVPESEPIEAGTHMADGAGVLSGSHEHSHFTFGIIEPGQTYDDVIRLDPWILFRQMELDRKRTCATTP